MSVTFAIGAETPVLANSRRQNWRRDQIFFVSMAIATALTIFVGFAPTYYLKTFTGAPPLSTLVHLHGLVFTTWVLLFVGQTALVASGRVRVHRQLGVAGTVVAGAMIVIGLLTAIAAARGGRTIGPLDPLGALVVPFVDIVIFAVMVTTALYFRQNREWHRRLMLLTMVGLLDPAIGRIPLVASHALGVIGLQIIFVLVGPIYDRLTRWRVHPTYIWGGLLIIMGFPLKFLGFTGPWRAFAAWLVR
jgi:hypothetical protein